MYRIIICLLTCYLCTSTAYTAEVDSDQNARIAAENELKRLSESIQILKKNVMVLNKDLRLMEENLLFPSNTKFSVFVSVTSGQFLKLDSIKLKINGRFVATHIYSTKEYDALLKGGIHRFHITNLSQKEHEVTAFISGIGPNNRAYKNAVSLKVEKGPGSQYLELAIGDDPIAQEPTFELTQW